MAVLKYIFLFLIISLYYQLADAQPYLWIAPTAEDIKSSKNSLWNGDLEDFDIDAEHTLKLNAKEAGQSVLNLHHKGLGYKLDFRFTQNHNPSNSNCLAVDLIQSVHGSIRLILGENGSNDHPKIIYKHNNADDILLGECNLDISNIGTYDVHISLFDFPESIHLSVKESTKDTWTTTDVSLSPFFSHSFYTSELIQFLFKYTSSRKKSYSIENIKIYYDNPKIFGFSYSDRKFRLFTNQQLSDQFDKIELTLNEQNIPIKGSHSKASISELIIDKSLQYTDYSLKLKQLYSFLNIPFHKLDTLFTVTNPYPDFGDLKAFLLGITNNQLETIGIINCSDKAIRLSDLALNLNGSQINLATKDQIIRAKQKIVLTHNAELITNSNTIYLDESFSFKDDLYINIQLEGKILDSLRTNKHWYTTINEYLTIYRKYLSGSSSDYSNWCLSTELLHTEWFQDLDFEEDNSQPYLKYALLKEDTLFCIFNEFIRTNHNTKLFINGVNQESVINTKDNIVSVKVDTLLSFNAFEIQSIYDLSGNVCDIEDIITKEADSNSIIINEILADPLQDETDNIIDQMEFIELYNPNPFNVDLSNCFLSKGYAEGHWLSPKRMEPIQTALFMKRPIIAAHSFFILYADKQSSFKKSFFYLQSSTVDSTKFYNFGGSSLSLTNEKATVCFVNSTGFILDSLTYNSDFHNPHLIDRKGISMERVANTFSGIKKSDNWTSCTAKNGITPLALNSNSIIEKTESSIEETQSFGIKLNSPIISERTLHYPNILEIEVTSKEIEQFLTLSIYDRNGRLVKKLASQQPIGRVSTFIWDGLDQYNHKLSEGFYIIFAKIKSGENESEKIIQKSVVLAH